MTLVQTVAMAAAVVAIVATVIWYILVFLGIRELRGIRRVLGGRGRDRDDEDGGSPPP